MLIETGFNQFNNFVELIFRDSHPILVGSWFNLLTKTIIAILSRPVINLSAVLNLTTCKPVVKLIAVIFDIDGYNYPCIFNHHFPYLILSHLFSLMCLISPKSLNC